MDFNATIDLIIKDLNEARDIIDDLKKYPGVPMLQVELAKAKCKTAGEVISLLKNLKEIIPPAEEQKQETKKVPETTSEAETIALVKEPDSIPAVEEKPENKRTGKKSKESAIMADKFSHLSNRFNEKLGAQKGEDDFPDMFKTKPLSNLSEAIGVNDRFLFIREIFNDNKDAYTSAMSQLDKAENMNDARAILMSYTGNSEENKAVKQLLSLVKRKLPSNE